jgi:transposase-like protein
LGQKAAHHGMSGKTTVIGAISRKGNVVCQIIENTDAATLNTFVRQAVSESVNLVATDEHGGYAHLDAIGFQHEAISHSTGELSLLKRGVVGTFHNVSKDYLPLYLAEFSLRHNNRKNPDIFADLLSRC